MESESSGFVKRDGPLLFAIMCEDRAYLIDIMGHDFANEYLALLNFRWVIQQLG